MMVTFITLLTFAFDINMDLLIKDLIKFEVLGSKSSSGTRFIVQSSMPLLFEAWGAKQYNDKLYVCRSVINSILKSVHSHSPHNCSYKMTCHTSIL